MCYIVIWSSEQTEGNSNMPIRRGRRILTGGCQTNPQCVEQLYFLRNSIKRHIFLLRDSNANREIHNVQDFYDETIGSGSIMSSSCRRHVVMTSPSSANPTPPPTTMAPTAATPAPTATPTPFPTIACTPYPTTPVPSMEPTQTPYPTPPTPTPPMTCGTYDDGAWRLPLPGPEWYCLSGDEIALVNAATCNKDCGCDFHPKTCEDIKSHVTAGACAADCDSAVKKLMLQGYGGCDCSVSDSTVDGAVQSARWAAGACLAVFAPALLVL